MTAPRYFAIIPAAGSSLRMGQPKLLLPIADRPLIAWTIAAWKQSRANVVAIVVRPDDVTLADIAGQAGAQVIIPPAAPPDMKNSIQVALRYLAQTCSPTEHDAFLVAPADMPRLSPAIANRLIDIHRGGDRDAVLLPELHGERGHPVLFPWTMAAKVFQLASDEGLNAVVDRSLSRRIPCDDLVPAIDDPFADIDTPADFQRLAKIVPPDPS